MVTDSPGAVGTVVTGALVTTDRGSLSTGVHARWVLLVAVPVVGGELRVRANMYKGRLHVVDPTTMGSRPDTVIRIDRWEVTAAGPITKLV